MLKDKGLGLHRPLYSTDILSAGDPWTGCEQEAQIEAALEESNVDLVVLARYMQIFSEDFCSRHAMHTINIHHSFLPAFEGLAGHDVARSRGSVSPCSAWHVQDSARCCACQHEDWSRLQVQSRTTEHMSAV